MANSIDQATKVNLGILGTLLASAVGGAVYLSTLHSSVEHVSQTLTEVKQAIDKTNAQLSVDSKALAVLQALTDSLERRLAILEKDKAR